MNRRTLLSRLSFLTLSAATRNIVEAAETASPYAVSDADLFAILDYAHYPALSAVQKAATANDIPTAKRAFAAYLRARKTVPWVALPMAEAQSDAQWDTPALQTAAKRGEVVIAAIPHTFPDAKINWAYNATGKAHGLPGNNEWTWQLNRMVWWNTLVASYKSTGDESWARLWVDQFRSWAIQCPVPAKRNNGAGSPWRTIETGIRIQGVWPDAYQAFLLSPSFTDDDLILFVRLAAAHGRYLAENHSGGNWLTMEMNGLYSAGCLFPELKEAENWRKQAATAMLKEQKVQFLPDGAQFELTPGYHNVALRNVLAIYRRGFSLGRQRGLSPDYLNSIEKALEFNLYLSTPDRNLPRMNDSWPVDVPRVMRDAGPLYPKREDFLFIASGGKKGTMPRETSHAFPYAGYFVMRDGWQTDSCMSVFDAGPLGNGHSHQDKLNLIVYAYGREILFDSGGGSYESSKYRSFATDTFGHNCVLVDGKPQRRSTKDRASKVSDVPIDVHWESTPERDYAEGVYKDGYGTVTDQIATHTRRVLFLKPTESLPAMWFVSDVLKPADTYSHSYQARWQLLTTNTQTDAKTKAIATTDAHQPNLIVMPLRTEGLEVRSASAQTEPELLGWNVRKDMDPQYVPATTVLHTRSGTGEQRFLTLLLPLSEGITTNLIQEVHIVGTNVILRLTGGRTLAVTDDSSGPLSVTKL
jgi:hypothetical protein